MPEGDYLARIARTLGELLVGCEVRKAGGRSAARLDLLAGRIVESVNARGKHLLIGFSGGLTLHTHLGLHGSWHRYRTGESWRRPPSRAAVAIEVEGFTCVCFDAPTVELIETRALPLHPVLARLGPDVADAAVESRELLGRLRDQARRGQPVGEALLDQRLVAGLGNVYRSELCFLVGLHPATALGEIDDATLVELLDRAARLVAASAATGRRVTTAAGRSGALHVYGRAGRPCRRCGAIVRSAMIGRPARRTYWCPRCQLGADENDPKAATHPKSAHG